MFRHSWSQVVLLLLGALAFAFATDRLASVKRVDPSPELAVALPLFVQVAMAGGDRHLAANMAFVRALVTESQRMTADDYRLLAKIQRDVAWLNPAHEDNYYIAAAILAWNREVNAAQYVLRRAAQARPFDYQPSFFYSFNLYYFDKDPVAASAWLREAAEKLDDPNERLAMRNFAARWLDRSKDLELAIRVIEAMATHERRPDFRKYLLRRVERLRILAGLREAADRYRRQTGQPLKQIDQLVAAGLIDAVPADPFGFGFAVGKDGDPIILNVKRK